MCSFFISISVATFVDYTLRYVMTRTRTVLRESSGLVTQQIFDPSKFLWECTCTDDRAWNLAVRHNLLGVYCFAHVEVNAKTFGDILAIRV